MALKFIILAAFVALAKASGIGAPVALSAPVLAEPYDHNPQYSYGYEVQDPLTGDSHGQVETRTGDVVRGSYALLDSDGTRRQVDYSADSINGFNAVVSKTPIARAVVAAPAVARVAAPVLPAAPLVRAAPVVSAPLGYSAPVVPAPLGYSAPLVSAPLPGLARYAAPAPILPAPAPLLRTAAYAAPYASAPVLSAPWAAPALRAAPWLGGAALRANVW